MKSYTDLKQSKKLAEFLPLESADMFWYRDAVTKEANPRIMNYTQVPERQSMYYSPCWSLAALLNALPKIMNHETLFVETSPSLWHIGYRNVYIARADTLVDACYEMIIKLHELNLL